MPEPAITTVELHARADVLAAEADVIWHRAKRAAGQSCTTMDPLSVNAANEKRAIASELRRLADGD
jgi:hypothetical protein